MLLKRMNLNVSVRPVLVGLARKGAETDVQGHRASPRFYLLEITTANDRVLGPGGDREGSMAIEAIVAVLRMLLITYQSPEKAVGNSVLGTEWSHLLNHEYWLHLRLLYSHQLILRSAPTHSERQLRFTVCRCFIPYMQRCKIDRQDEGAVVCSGRRANEIV